MNTQTELTNRQMHQAFTVLMGFGPRPADVAVLTLVGATPQSLGTYLWDHWLREPQNPTCDEVIGSVVRILQEES